MAQSEFRKVFIDSFHSPPFDALNIGAQSPISRTEFAGWLPPSLTFQIIGTCTILMPLFVTRILTAGLASLVVAATGSLPGNAQDNSPVTGIWLTEKGDARIRITTCGAGICGKVIALREPIDPDTGKPATDNKNPNPALAQRPVIGLNLFNDMRATGPASWAGRIYNADDGQFYASKVMLQGPARLRVEGCVGALCGGETWSKVGN